LTKSGKRHIIEKVNIYYYYSSVAAEENQSEFYASEADSERRSGSESISFGKHVSDGDVRYYVPPYAGERI
jgi:hypothetical protein